MKKRAKEDASASGDPPRSLTRLCAIEGEVVEINQESGEVLRLCLIHKLVHDRITTLPIDHLDNPRFGMREFAQRSDLVPPVAGQLEITIQDQILHLTRRCRIN
jgi:hypothetical protein